MGHHVVRLRLARWGQRHRPFYRIVAASSRSKRDGRHLEIVGAYNPLFHSAREKQARIKRVWLNVDRIQHWLASGAQPSETVARLLGSSGLLPISPRTLRKQQSQHQHNASSPASASSSPPTSPLSTVTAAAAAAGTNSSAQQAQKRGLSSWARVHETVTPSTGLTAVLAPAPPVHRSSGLVVRVFDKSSTLQ